MGARLLIEGVNYSDITEGLDEVIITYKKGESAMLNYSISNPLFLTERGYNLLNNVFFADPCAGKKATLKAQLITDCCGEEIVSDFKLTYESVVVSQFDCRAEIILNVDNPLQTCYEYLRDTPFWKNGFREDFQSPKIRYCIDRANFFLFVWVLIVMGAILLVLELVETVINSIIGVFAFLFNLIANIFNFDAPIIENLLNNFLVDIPSADNFIAYLTGAGNFHFAPYFRDIFDHNIAQANIEGNCSMTVKIPILQSEPYSELTIFNAAAKGFNCNVANDTFRFSDKAVYNRTATQLATELADVFNMEFVITPDGSFRVDTVENLTNSAPELANPELAYQNGLAEEAPTFEFEVGKFYKQSYIQYSKDTVDEEGNFLHNKDYSDVVDWPGAFIGAERREKTLKFAGSRFMFDRITAETDGFFDSDLQKDRFRQGIFGGLNFGGVIGIIDDIACLPRETDLILSNHTCSLPKLLVLEPGTDLNDAKTIKRNHSVNGNTTFFNYNFPMKLEYEEEYEELMKGFYSVDDPDHPHNRYVVMQPFTLSLNPDMIRSIRDNGIFVSFRTRYGLAMPEQIDVNFSNCTAVITGCKFKCAP